MRFPLVFARPALGGPWQSGRGGLHGIASKLTGHRPHPQVATSAAPPRNDRVGYALETFCGNARLPFVFARPALGGAWQSGRGGLRRRAPPPGCHGPAGLAM